MIVKAHNKSLHWIFIPLRSIKPVSSTLAWLMEMTNKNIIIYTLLILTSAMNFGFDSANYKAESVSLTQLIGNPTMYHGEIVRVIGASLIEFESNSIWLTREHYKFRIYDNALSIEPDYKALGVNANVLEMYNGKYVLMEGIFNKDDRGHGSMFGGTLEKVTRFQLWEKE